MGKQDEIDYLKKIGKAGLEHSRNKPFSDDLCGIWLAELGAIMSLLPPPPAKILDLGCGTGWTSRFLANRGYEVTGVDISGDMITYADIKRYQEKIENLKFFTMDFENMVFDSEFDYVIFFDSLHHSENEEKAIRSAYCAVKTGGMCLVSEPGKGHKYSPTAINAREKYNITEKDLPPKLIIRHGKKAGFKRFKVYPRACYIHAALYADPDKISRLRYLKKIFRFNFIRTLAVIFIVTFFKRFDGIIVMTK